MAFRRPAFIHLPSEPLHVRSSPDGTALVIVEGSPIGTKSIRVFHRASFGSNESGIVKELPEIFNPTSNFCITSTGERQKVFLMGFDGQKQRVISAALEISRKETEYQFRASGEAINTAKRTHTMHNSLIDCFSEVWDRFPVAPAIQRFGFLVATFVHMVYTTISQTNPLRGRASKSKRHLCVVIS